MTIKQTMRFFATSTALVLSLFALTVLFAQPTFAAKVNSETENGCEVETAIIHCENIDNDATGAQKTGLWSLLITAINILTAGVGVAALGGIVYGAVLYSSAGGNPEQVKKARTIFLNVSIGVVAFAGMWALLNFIIPGGAFTLL